MEQLLIAFMRPMSLVDSVICGAAFGLLVSIVLACLTDTTDGS